MMRWMTKMVAMAGLAAALLAGTAVPGSASQPVSPMVTDGNTFLEVDDRGEFVRWQRSGETFEPVHLSGMAGGGSRLITCLDAKTCLEISHDGTLIKWIWTGSGHTRQVVGFGWQNARCITGIGPDRFLELTNNGRLVLWTFGSDGRLTSRVLGDGWQDTRMLIGLGDLAFIEVKSDGTASEWTEMGEQPLPMLNLSDARLSTGLDRQRFVVVNTTGELVEYESNTWGYVPTVRVKDFSHARLIG